MGRGRVWRQSSAGKQGESFANHNAFAFFCLVMGSLDELTASEWYNLNAWNCFS